MSYIRQRMSKLFSMYKDVWESISCITIGFCSFVNTFKIYKLKRAHKTSFCTMYLLEQELVFLKQVLVEK